MFTCAAWSGWVVWPCEQQVDQTQLVEPRLDFWMGPSFPPPPTRFPYGDTSDRVMGNDWFIVNISASVQRSAVAATAQHWRLVRTTFAFTPKWDGLARKPSDRRASLNTDLSHQAVEISTPQIQTLRVENKLTMPLLPTVVQQTWSMNNLLVSRSSAKSAALMHPKDNLPLSLPLDPTPPFS